MKRTFIPKSFRPSVPGSTLKTIEMPQLRKGDNVETHESIVILSSMEDLVAKKILCRSDLLSTCSASIF